jgi:hypothetical protein
MKNQAIQRGWTWAACRELRLPFVLFQ